MANKPPLDLAVLRSALAEAGMPWQMAETPLTRMSQEEREIRLGVPLPESLDDSPEAIQAAATLALEAKAEDIGAPASFDVRNVGGVNYDTAIKNQGGCGSCVAFGSAGAMEVVFRYSRRTTLPLDLSEAHLFYKYARDEGRNCGNGWWPDRALLHARDSGVTFEDYFPYTAGDQDASKLNADWPNRYAKASAFEVITGNPAKMKEYISSYGAVTACLVVYNDFFSYRTGVYRHVTGGVAGGHCVVLIGYNDAEGYWIGRNSWGSGWGDGGYFKIAYGECNIESYQTVGVSGVTVNAWLPNQQVLGLWSNEYDANVWTYGSQRGWLKLDSGNAVTNQAMLSELAAAKALGRPVGLFENNGSVTQIYAW